MVIDQRDGQCMNTIIESAFGMMILIIIESERCCSTAKHLLNFRVCLVSHGALQICHFPCDPLTKKQGYVNFLSQHVRVINPNQKQCYPFIRQFETAGVYKKNEHWLVSSTHRRDHEVHRPHCTRAFPCCFLSVAYPSFRCDCEDIPS